MSAYDVHEWIHNMMQLTEADVAMVQVDGAKWQVFIKLREFNKMQEILTST
jgi:ribosomal protein L25 (general stress protein Ctc)